MTSLTVSRDPVLVPQLPVYDMVLHPMVMRVWLGSAFVGHTSQTTRVCATLIWRYAGISWYLIGFIVFVPENCCVLGLVGCLLTAWQSRPISSA